MSEAQRKSVAGQGKVNEIATINAQRKIELEGLRALQKEYVNTKKVQDLQEGSIKALRAQLSNLNALYDSLGRTQRKGAYGKGVDSKYSCCYNRTFRSRAGFHEVSKECRKLCFRLEWT